MQRLRIVLLLFFILAVPAIVAWLVLGGLSFDPEGTPPGGPAGVAAGTDGGSGETEPARRRVGQGEDTAAIEGRDGLLSIAGRVVHGEDGIGGATVEAFAVPEGAESKRVRRARAVFGDLFTAEELEEMDGQMGMNPFGSTVSANPRNEDDGGSVAVTVDVDVDAGASPAEEAPTEAPTEAQGFDVSQIDFESEEFQNNASRGMDMAARLFSEEGLMDRVLELARMEMAGFDDDAPWNLVASARTTPDGAFLLEGLPQGRIELRVAASGFVRGKKTVAAGDADVKVELHPGALLEGTVVSGGQPVGGATVRTRTTTLTTDGAGAFRLDGAVTPRESLLVTARGFVPAGRYVDLTLDGPNEPVAVELTQAGIVAGVVIDNHGAPVPGAAISVGGGGFNPMVFMSLANQDTLDAPKPSVRSDADGRFELDGLAAGSVTLVARCSGYLAGSVKDLQVVVGATVEGVEIELMRESVLSGRVTSSDGSAVARATVKVEAPAAQGMGAMIAGMMGGSWASARTDEDGAYRVRGLHAGDRKVRVEAQGYLHAEETFAIPAEGEAEKAFQLVPGHTVSGSVLDPSGQPVAGARVGVKWKGSAGQNPMLAMMGVQGGPDADARTDASGEFKVVGLQAGPYDVTAKAQGFLEVTQKGVAEEATDVLLQLRAASGLRGIVVDADSGQPVAGASVIRKGGRSRGGAPWMQMMRQDPRVLTDKDGAFAMLGLDPGKYELLARRKGFADSEPLKVVCSEGTVIDDLQLALRPGEVLRGRVLERGSAAPLEGVLIFVSLNEGPLAGLNPQDIVGGEPTAPGNSISTKTDPSGEFVLEGLSPGRVTLQARSRDHAPASLGADVPGPDVTIEIGPGGAIEGHVVDRTGAARPGVSVMLSGGAMGFGVQRPATTDDAGFYRIEKLVPGSYNIMLMGGEGAFGMEGMSPVLIKDGETTQKDFRPKAGGGPVEGVVLRDGQPLPGAMVVLSGGNAGFRMEESDADGKFRFEGLEPGEYTVLVQSEIFGGGSNSEKVKVDESGTVANVRLELTSLAVSGTVVDAESGEPIALAQVILFEEDAGTFTSLDDVMQNQRGQTFSDDQGRFEISGVPQGSFSLRISAGGYIQQRLEGVASGGAPVTVRLAGGGEFVVTVLAPDGSPAQNASVSAEDSAGNEAMPFDMTMQNITDAEGKATLRLAPGTYTLHVEKTEFPLASLRVETRSGGATVRLIQGGSVEVVATRAGQPLSGARVRFLDADDKEIARRVSMANFMGSAAATDAAGRVIRDGLPVGKVTVVLTPPDGEDVRREARVGAGGKATVRFELR